MVVQSRGKGGLVIIAFVLIVVVGFIAFGNKFEPTESLHKKIFGEKSFKMNLNEPKTTETNIVLPPKENKWCKIQELVVDTDREAPQRDRIIGWDNINKCCVKSVYGYDCALNREIETSYCYTAHIGGIVKWVMVDGYYGQEKLYQHFLDNLDKEAILNKPCDDTNYPKALQVMEE